VLHTAAARGDRVLAGFAAAPAAGRADKAAAAEPPDEDEPSNTAALSLWPVERILVRDRKRKDLGDLKPLAESIAALGLLHPIVVRPDGTLIAGARRLAACRDVLGLAEVPVRVLDIGALVRGEADENTQRLGFAPEEALKVYGAVLEEEKRLARERQKAGLRRGKEKAPAEDVPVPGIARDGGEARDLAAAITGYSEKSLRMTRIVARHGEAEADIFDAVLEDIKRGRIQSPVPCQWNITIRAQNTATAHVML
jgi:ParB-like chromosome segregation protein Spo0J